jgi:hypothetical protein
MKKKLAIASAIDLAVLLCVGLLLRSAFEGDAPPPPPPPVAARPDPGRNASEPAAVRREARRESPALPRAEAIDPEPGPAPDPLGLGVLRGRVVDRSTRRPVPAALVRVALEPAGPSLEETPWLAEAEADAQGAFELGCARGRPYRVRITAAGWRDGEWENAAAREDGPGGEPLPEYALASDAGIPCRLELEHEGGIEPLPDREVILEASAARWSFTGRSDASGALTILGIEPGALLAARAAEDLEVGVPGYAGALLTMDPDGSRATVHVERGVTVIGVVRDAATRLAVAGASVHADSGETVEADASGRFQVDGVLEKVAADAAGYAPRTAEIDAAGTAIARVEVLLERGRTLSGRVLRGSAGPFPGVEIALLPSALDLDFPARLVRRIAGGKAAVSAADGSYEIGGIPADSLALPGLISVRVAPPGNGRGWSEEVDVEEEALSWEHDFTIAGLRRLPGRVVDPEGEPAAGVLVRVQALERDAAARAVTDAMGRFILEDLPAGGYVLEVEGSGRLLHAGAFDVPREFLDVALEPGAPAERRTDGGE